MKAELCHADGQRDRHDKADSRLYINYDALIIIYS